MAASRQGVMTIPGHLTHYLDSLELSRKELASRLQVSVRTVHNIEHGRKAVDPRLLSRLATVLNERSAVPAIPCDPLNLTEDYFIKDPESVAKVFLQSIMLNDCSPFFLGDDPIATRDLRWLAPGRPDEITFAGDYQGLEIYDLMKRMHSTIQLAGIDNPRFLRDQKSEMMLIRAHVTFKHPDTSAQITFKSLSELMLADCKISLVDSYYDAALVSEFIRSGKVPERSKSDDLLRWVAG